MAVVSLPLIRLGWGSRRVRASHFLSRSERATGYQLYRTCRLENLLPTQKILQFEGKGRGRVYRPCKPQPWPDSPNLRNEQESCNSVMLRNLRNGGHRDRIT